MIHYFTIYIYPMMLGMQKWFSKTSGLEQSLFLDHALLLPALVWPRNISASQEQTSIRYTLKQILLSLLCFVSQQKLRILELSHQKVTSHCEKETHPGPRAAEGLGTVSSLTKRESLQVLTHMQKLFQ